MLLDKVVTEDELVENHCTRPHRSRAMIETSVLIGDVKEPVVALIDHRSEINLMSMDFYKKGTRPINTKHGWKIHAATRAMEELHGACPECLTKSRGRRDRPTLFHARDIFSSGHSRRAIHHGSSNGDQSARQLFSLRNGKESRRSLLCTILDSAAESRA